MESNPINHDINELIQTQDLEPLYIENSGFYIFSKDNFNSGKNRISLTRYSLKQNFRKY